MFYKNTAPNYFIFPKKFIKKKPERDHLKFLVFFKLVIML